MNGRVVGTIPVTGLRDGRAGGVCGIAVRGNIGGLGETGVLGDMGGVGEIGSVGETGALGRATFESIRVGEIGAAGGACCSTGSTAGAF